MTWARRWHALTAVVAIGAVVLPAGAGDPGRPGARRARRRLTCQSGCYRLVAYFTIQSNLLVAIAAVAARPRPGPRRDGLAGAPAGRCGSASRSPASCTSCCCGRCSTWRARTTSPTSCCTWRCPCSPSWAGRRSARARGSPPRDRPGPRSGRSPGWRRTLVVGALSGWYPYPFLDHREDGVGAVVVASVGITVLFLAVFALIAWIDGRATPAPEPDCDHERGHRPHRPAERHRLRRVRRARGLLGAPAPLRPVRPRRLLRHLARPARHRPLQGHRSPR